MKRSLILIALALSLAACSSTGTKFVSDWANPDFKGKTLEDVMVIGVSEKDGARRMFEGSLAAEFQKAGVNAVQSVTLLPTTSMLTKEDVEKVLKEQNIDAVIVTRLLDISQTENYVPPSTTVVGGYGYPGYGGAYYGSYYGYYSTSYSTVTSPGYTYTETTVSLETNLYDASTEALVWSGQSATFNPDSVQDVVTPTAKQIVDHLIQNGFVNPKKK